MSKSYNPSHPQSTSYRLDPASLRDRFLALLERHVGKLHIVGHKVTGLAPCHDDHTPSFSADLDRCTWYCFACARGGGVREFAALVGEKWEASRAQLSTKRAHVREAYRSVLKRAYELYETWCYWRFQDLADEYQGLLADREVAEAAYRLLYRHPDLFSEEERNWWEGELARTYDWLPQVEGLLDLFTFREHEEERLRLFMEGG